MTKKRRILHVNETRIVGDDGPMLLRGFGLGGWMNTENFITGHAGTESQQRRALRRSLSKSDTGIALAQPVTIRSAHRNTTVHA